MVRRVSCAAAIIALVWAISAAADESSTQTVELPTTVKGEIAKLPDSGPPTSPLRLIKANINAGSKTSPSEKRFERLDHGMWGVSWLLPGSNGKGILRQMLTLEGMIELASTTTMSFEYGGTTAIPLAKIFLPFRIVNSFHGTFIRNTQTLTGDLDAMVTPSPGAKFSYEHTYDIQATTTGMFGGTRTSTHVAKMTCSVGATADVGELGGGLRGAYLPVTCEGTVDGGNQQSHQYAYLAASQLYVLLASTFSSGKEIHTITAAEYGP